MLRIHSKPDGNLQKLSVWNGSKLVCTVILMVIKVVTEYDYLTTTLDFAHSLKTT